MASGDQALHLNSPLPFGATARKSPTQRLEWCDGLRGWFALLVLWHHFGSFHMGLLPQAYDLLMGLGAGVSMSGFFVLSSFLLTYRLAGEMQSFQSNAREWRAIARAILYFAIRRLFRIYPLFWVVAALTFRYEAYCGECIKATANNKVKFLSLVDVGNAFFWSLSIEMKSYATIPLVCIAWRFASKSEIGRHAMIAILTCLIVATNCVWGSYVEPGSNHLPWLTVFLSGCTVALVFLCLIDSENRRVRPRRVYLLSAATLLLFAAAHAITSRGVGFTVPGRPELNQYWFENSVYPGYIIALAFLCAILAGENEPCFLRFFGLKLMQYVGSVSYSLYLLQFFIIKLSTSLLPEMARFGLIHFAVVTTAAVGVATVSYRAVELPSMRCGARVLKLCKGYLEKKRYSVVCGTM